MRVLTTSLAVLACAAIATAVPQSSATQKAPAPPTGKKNPSAGSYLPPGGFVLLSTDDCSSPTPISGSGSHAFDTTAATTSGFNGTGTCPSGASTIGKDLFWQWTADSAGTWVFDTCGSSFDTKLSVHLGPDCSAVCLGYNDDASGCGTASRVTINGVSIGDVLLIQVGGFSTANGVGVLNIGGPPPPPANDDCSTATVISGSGNHAYSTLAASASGFDGGGACGTTAMGKDIFYEWTATSAGTWVFDTCGSTYDTKLSVHLGPDCTAVCLGYNDDACSLQSSVTINGVSIGDVFLVQVGGFSTASGSGVLNIGGPPPPVANDECSTAELIAGQGIFPYNSTNATTSLEGQNEPLCDFFSQIGIAKDLWFEWTADATGTATVTTCNQATFDTKLAAYDGAGCPLDGSAIACNDDDCSFRSTISFPVVAGGVYMLQAGSYAGGTPSGGASALDISIAPAPTPIVPYCFGDGTGTPCPCVNDGGPGEGCANSTGSGSALSWTGSASVVADDLVLIANNLQIGNNNFGLFFQGTSAVNGGLGDPFGDGLRCAQGLVQRLQIVASVNGTATTTASISGAGGVLSGDTLFYQCWYRNPSGPCSDGYNLSSALEVTWSN